MHFFTAQTFGFEDELNSLPFRSKACMPDGFARSRIRSNFSIRKRSKAVNDKTQELISPKTAFNWHSSEMILQRFKSTTLFVERALPK